VQRTQVNVIVYDERRHHCSRPVNFFFLVKTLSVAGEPLMKRSVLHRAQLRDILVGAATCQYFMSNAVSKELMYILIAASIIIGVSGFLSRFVSDHRRASDVAKSSYQPGFIFTC
jgi:hypothetical protein